MSEPFYTIELAGLEKTVFQTKNEFEKWLKGEREAWEWLWTEDAITSTIGPNTFHQMRNGFENILIHFPAISSEHPLLKQAEARYIDQPLRTFFSGRGQNTLFASNSVDGRRIAAIREQLGVDAARWHLVISNRQMTVANAVGNEDLSLIIGGFMLDEGITGDLGVTLRKERTTYRAEITKLENRVRELETERRDDRNRLSNATRRLARKRLARYEADWEERQTVISEKVDTAVGSITETEDRFRTQMGLRAPVQYWRKKARVHGQWEAGYSFITVLFFGVAATAIYYMAQGAIEFLKEFSGENETSAYIITSAALLAGTTLIFWLGRVIVKLFLSEHHLRSDCQEKAVMTEAFLAMSDEDDALSETERSIVLASIFRSSPDGIVKEDGPVDFGAAAILGKALSR